MARGYCIFHTCKIINKSRFYDIIILQMLQWWNIYHPILFLCGKATSNLHTVRSEAPQVDIYVNLCFLSYTALQELNSFHNIMSVYRGTFDGRLWPVLDIVHILCYLHVNAHNGCPHIFFYEMHISKIFDTSSMTSLYIVVSEAYHSYTNHIAYMIWKFATSQARWSCHSTSQAAYESLYASWYILPARQDGTIILPVSCYMNHYLPAGIFY